MEKDYKKIINVLLIINAICLIVIAALCGEIYLLQEKLSELTDTIQTLNTKISHLESIQYETMYGDQTNQSLKLEDSLKTIFENI